MISRLRKTARRHRRTFAHAAVVVGLIPKFLVPVGYMPAALADGGPLMLCDAYPGVLQPDAAHGMAMPHAAHAAPDAGSDPHEPGADRNAHGEWKRCSLGGLASLATIHSDWRAATLPVTHERVDATTTVGDTRVSRIPFRSRAPPAA